MQERQQLDQLLGEVVAELPVAVAVAAQGVSIEGRAARCAADTEIDTARIERMKDAESSRQLSVGL